MKRESLQQWTTVVYSNQFVLPQSNFAKKKKKFITETNVMMYKNVKHYFPSKLVTILPSDFPFWFLHCSKVSSRGSPIDDLGGTYFRIEWLCNAAQQR